MPGAGGELCASDAIRSATVDDKIAHALQIAVDLDGGGEEAQVSRDRLMPAPVRRNRDFIDFDVELVDAVFHLPEFLRRRLLAFHQPTTGWRRWPIPPGHPSQGSGSAGPLIPLRRAVSAR